MEPEPIDKILPKVAPRRVTRDEDTPFLYRYKCLLCQDTGVENYVDPEAPLNVYGRPCKHCVLGQAKLKAWRSRKWRGHVDGKPIPYVWRSGSAAEIAEIMAYPCDHDGALLEMAREVFAPPKAGSQTLDPEYPDP